MRQVINIFKKELKSYFISPIAYIVISIFLLVTGWFFFATFFIFNQATLRSFFDLLPIIFSFVVPAITMRLFSEELNLGSYEILMRGFERVQTKSAVISRKGERKSRS